MTTKQPKRAIDPELIRRHLVRMRALCAAALVAPILAAGAGLVIPHRPSPVIPELVVTLLAIGAGLWFAVSAERDAARRLLMIRRGFVAHHDPKRLLREHLLVYLVVLVRLEAITACGLMISITGNGPMAALPVYFISVIQIVRSWPSAHKTRLLLLRVMASVE